MKKTYILTLIDKKERNTKGDEELGCWSRIAAKSTARSLRKVLKKHKGGIVVVSNDSVKESVLKGVIKPYTEISILSALEIIEKTCRAVALKYSLKLPLEDLYIYARPEIACDFVKRLLGLSRMYTIISDSTGGSVADELYFEYGCPIRHIRKRNLAEVQDSISIFIEKCASAISPIINITKEDISGKNVTDLRKISIMDDSMNELTQSVFPKGGLPLYALLEEKPSGNITLDITKTADTIFLLDTNVI